MIISYKTKDSLWEILQNSYNVAFLYTTFEQLTRFLFNVIPSIYNETIISIYNISKKIYVLHHDKNHISGDHILNTSVVVQWGREPHLPTIRKIVSQKFNHCLLLLAM